MNNTTSNYVRLAYAASPGNSDKKHLADIHVLKDRTSQIESDQDENLNSLNESVSRIRNLKKGPTSKLNSYKFIDSLLTAAMYRCSFATPIAKCSSSKKRQKI